MTTLHPHQIKINRAIKLSQIGRHPASAAAMLDTIPAEVIAALPARLIAAQMDANWEACQSAKRAAQAEALENGFVWDVRHDRAVDLVQ